MLLVVTLATLLVSALAGTEMRGVRQQVSVGECIADPIPPSRLPPMYNIYGSTSSDFNGAVSDSHRMVWVEKLASCNLKHFLQGASATIVGALGMIPLFIRPSGIPGESEVTTMPEIHPQAPVVFDYVMIDVDCGVIALEMSFSGLLIGGLPGQKNKGALHLPGIRMKISAAHSLKGIGSTGPQIIHVDNVALRIGFTEPPHTIHDNDPKAYVFSGVDWVLEELFKRHLADQGNASLTALATNIKDAFNARLSTLDVSPLEPQLLYWFFLVSRDAGNMAIEDLEAEVF